MYGIKILGPINEGEWLQWFDHDAHEDSKLYPTGNGGSTEDPIEAMSSETVEDAWSFWRRVSEVTPTRPDGKPNRPLTFFSISVERIDENEL